MFCALQVTERYGALNVSVLVGAIQGERGYCDRRPDMEPLILDATMDQCQDIADNATTVCDVPATGSLHSKYLTRVRYLDLPSTSGSEGRDVSLLAHVQALAKRQMLDYIIPADAVTFLDLN